MGNISAPIVKSRGTTGISHHKKNLADALLDMLQDWGT